jgi:hypothetical protein
MPQRRRPASTIASTFLDGRFEGTPEGAFDVGAVYLE